MTRFVEEEEERLCKSKTHEIKSLKQIKRSGNKIFRKKERKRSRRIFPERSKQVRFIRVMRKFCGRWETMKTPMREETIQSHSFFSLSLSLVKEETESSTLIFRRGAIKTILRFVYQNFIYFCHICSKKKTLLRKEKNVNL